MTHDPTEQEIGLSAEDAQFDAWLRGIDAAVLPRLEMALDLDAGRAEIFATAVCPESVPEPDTVDPQEMAAFAHSLDGLSRQTAQIEQWLAKSAPNYLPFQLDQAYSVTRTMIVVGRALLSESMPEAWGLASDFLQPCLSDLLRLKTGLAQRDLERDEALALHTDVLEKIDSFRGVLRQCTHPAHGVKARKVSERLITAAGTVCVLLSWVWGGIEYLFTDSGQTQHLPVW